MSKHDDRAESLVAHEAATWISRAAGAQSMITVTRAERAAHGHEVIVYVSVFPAEESKNALAFLARERRDFSEHLKAHTRLRPLPAITFALDPDPSPFRGGPSGN